MHFQSDDDDSEDDSSFCFRSLLFPRLARLRLLSRSPSDSLLELLERCPFFFSSPDESLLECRPLLLFLPALLSDLPLPSLRRLLRLGLLSSFLSLLPSLESSRSFPDSTRLFLERDERSKSLLFSFVFSSEASPFAA